MCVPLQYRKSTIMLSFSDVYGAFVLAVQSCTRPTEIGRFFNVAVIDLPIKNAGMTDFVAHPCPDNRFTSTWIEFVNTGRHLASTVRVRDRHRSRAGFGCQDLRH